MAGGGKASEAVARVLLGTAISAALTKLALDGVITGRGPDDKRERNMLLQSGWQPYSIKIGKKYYSYKRIEPINKLLMLAGATAEAWKSKDTMEADKLAGRIMFDLSRSVLDTSYLQGMNDLFDAMTEPQRYGGRYIRRMAASFVPAGSRWATTTYFDDDMKDPQSFLDEAKAKIPGLSDDVFPRRDVFGEPIKQPQYLGGVLPIAVSETNPDPIYKEIYKLLRPQQGSGPQVGLPSRKVGKWQVPPDIYDRMVQQGGAEFKQGVVDRIGEYSAFWDSMEPDEKIDAINQAHREAWGSYRDFTGARGEFWPEIRERLVKDGVPEDDIEAWEYNELVAGDKLYGEDDEEFED